MMSSNLVCAARKAPMAHYLQVVLPMLADVRQPPIRWQENCTTFLCAAHTHTAGSRHSTQNLKHLRLTQKSCRTTASCWLIHSILLMAFSMPLKPDCKCAHTVQNYLQSVSILVTWLISV